MSNESKTALANAFLFAFARAVFSETKAEGTGKKAGEDGKAGLAAILKYWLELPGCVLAVWPYITICRQWK